MNPQELKKISELIADVKNLKDLIEKLDFRLGSRMNKLENEFATFRKDLTEDKFNHQRKLMKIDARVEKGCALHTKHDEAIKDVEGRLLAVEKRTAQSKLLVVGVVALSNILTAVLTMGILKALFNEF